MKRLTLAVLLVGLMAGVVLAEYDWVGPVGKWSDPCMWTNGKIPDGNDQIRIVSGPNSVCTLNSDAGQWPVSQRLRIYNGAKLVVEEGGSLRGVSWGRVGTADGPGYVEQKGGTISVTAGSDNSRFMVGDANGSQGSTYTIKGGTLTCADGEGSLWLGYRGGEGRLTIVGTGGKVRMRRLLIGGRDDGTRLASGILEFKVASAGVSPVKIQGIISLDPGGNESQAQLLVSATEAPPKANIVLVESEGSGWTSGTFDTVNDAPAKEGANVTLHHGGTDYCYTLTYKYDAAGDGRSNDIALIYAPRTEAAPEPKPEAKAEPAPEPEPAPAPTTE